MKPNLNHSAAFEPSMHHNQMRGVAIRELIIAAFFAGGLIPVFCDEPQNVFTEQEIDAVWADHLLWKNHQSTEYTPYNESLLREALRLNPADSRTLLDLHAYYLNINQTSLANMVAHYAQTIGLPTDHLNPVPGNHSHNAGSAGNASENTPPACDEAERTLVMDRYRLYCSKGNYVKAENTIRELLADCPDDTDLLAALGQIYLISREIGMGVMLFGYLHTLSPDDMDAANNYAFFLKALGQYRQALDVLCLAESKHPGHDMTIDNIISLAGNLNDLETARVYIEKWVRFSPNNPDAWMRRAHLMIFRNDLPQAKESALRALTLSGGGNNPGIYIYLAEISVRERQPDAARDWLEKMRSLIPPADFARVTSMPQFKNLFE